jgi:hypothetical protein
LRATTPTSRSELSVGSLNKRISRLQNALDAIDGFDVALVTPDNRSKLDGLRADITNAVNRAFDEGSSDRQRYRRDTSIRMIITHAVTTQEYQQKLAIELERVAEILRAGVRGFEADLEDIEPEAEAGLLAPASNISAHAPQSLSGPAMAAAIRAAHLVLEQAAKESEKTFFQSARDGRLGSSIHPDQVKTICQDGFRRAAGAAAQRFADLKGTKATGRSVELREALKGVAEAALAIFDRFDGTGSQYQKPLQTRAELAAKLESIASDICDDLSAGVFHVQGR